MANDAYTIATWSGRTSPTASITCSSRWTSMSRPVQATTWLPGRPNRTTTILRVTRRHRPQRCRRRCPRRSPLRCRPRPLNQLRSYRPRSVHLPSIHRRRYQPSSHNAHLCRSRQPLPASRRPHRCRPRPPRARPSAFHPNHVPLFLTRTCLATTTNAVGYSAGFFSSRIANAGSQEPHSIPRAASGRSR